MAKRLQRPKEIVAWLDSTLHSMLANGLGREKSALHLGVSYAIGDTLWQAEDLPFEVQVPFPLRGGESAYWAILRTETEAFYFALAKKRFDRSGIQSQVDAYAEEAASWLSMTEEFYGRNLKFGPVDLGDLLRRV